MNTDPEPSPPPPLQIDVLQAEVQALKTLVLSSPTSPLGELPSAGVKTPFRKGHSRNKSTSSAILGTQPDPSATQPIVRECREVGLYLTADTLYVSALLCDADLRWWTCRWTVSCSAISRRGRRSRRSTEAAASWREFTVRTSTPASPSASARYRQRFHLKLFAYKKTPQGSSSLSHY